MVLNELIKSGIFGISIKIVVRTPFKMLLDVEIGYESDFTDRHRSQIHRVKNLAFTALLFTCSYLLNTLLAFIFIQLQRIFSIKKEFMQFHYEFDSVPS